MRLQSSDTLTALVRQRGMTQAGLAAAAGCSPTFISKLCQGIKTSCTDTLAERIAGALDVPADVLFLPEQSPNGVRSIPSVVTA